MARTPEPGAGAPGAPDLGRIFGTARDFWQQREPEVRRSYVTWAVIGAVVLGGIGYFTTRNPMTLVFSNLAPADAGQVTQALTSLKIPYQLAGTSVYVPASEADQARVDLATQGLPAQGFIGYSSVISSSGIGMTDQQFNLATQNALQNDLAQTVESISGIAKANVLLQPAQASVFVDQPQSQATAAVFVDLMPGITLSPSQVLGIEELVAHSVQGLSVDHVSVVDQNGDPLTAASSADPSLGATGGGASGEMALQREFEQNLNAELTALLQPIVGASNVIVQTSATLDTTQTQTQSSLVQPLPSGQGVPVSNNTIKETFTGTGTPPTVSGSTTSPTYPAGATSGQSNLNYTDSTINYQVSHINQTVTSQPFTLKGLTVSVMLNAKTYHLTKSNRKALQQLIGTAVGFTGQKTVQSSITIFSAPFQKVQVPAFPTTSTLPTSPTMLAAAGGALILLVVLAFLLLRRRGARSARSPQRVQRQVLQSAPEPLPPVAPDPTRIVMDRVKELVQRDPEEAANLVRNWLREDTKSNPRRR